MKNKPLFVFFIVWFVCETVPWAIRSKGLYPRSISGLVIGNFLNTESEDFDFDVSLNDALACGHAYFTSEEVKGCMDAWGKTEKLLVDTHCVLKLQRSWASASISRVLFQKPPIAHQCSNAKVVYREVSNMCSPHLMECAKKFPLSSIYADVQGYEMGEQEESEESF